MLRYWRKRKAPDGKLVTHFLLKHILLILGVLLLKRLENINLNLCCVAISLHVLDDLDGYVLLLSLYRLLPIQALDHLPKRALAQDLLDLV